MKTIVYQSYRTTGMPRWIEACMQTVRDWAAGCGFEYRFIDDQLFDFAPAWYREKAGTEICPVADLARLVVARDLLAAGYDRTVWVDADVVVFDPAALDVRIDRDFAFCHELWLALNAAGQAVVSSRVNNAITVFHRQNVHLDFFIDACLRIARERPRLGKLDVGTAFLSQLGALLPLPLLPGVGMFSPPLMTDLAAGTERWLPGYAAQLSRPLACANLCASLLGGAADAPVCEAVVASLLQSRGEVVNRYVTLRTP